MKAAILAGGKSRRMGKDKSLLTIRGEALILHVARALRRIFPDTFVIANEPAPYEAMGFEVTPDSLPGNDSLGGLHAAVSRADDSHVFVAGCDMPFLQPALLSAMAELGEGWDVVIPVRDGYPEPLCALYGKACEAPIRRRIAAGQLKMIGFHQDVRVLRIEEDRWRAWDPEGLSFRNLNTPEEYEKVFQKFPRRRRMTVEEKFKELGIDLPEAAAPVGAYVPYVQSGNLLFISGQLPVLGGKLQHKGKAGGDVDMESAQAAAKLCFLNAVAQAKTALGNLDRIKRIVQLSGFVASAKDFTDQPLVVNGASECAVQAFGDAGKHSRLALGVAELPMGAVVEVGVIFEVS